MKLTLYKLIFVRGNRPALMYATHVTHSAAFRTKSTSDAQHDRIMGQHSTFKERSVTDGKPDTREAVAKVIETQIDGLIALCNILKADSDVIQALEDTRGTVRKTLQQPSSSMVGTNFFTVDPEKRTPRHKVSRVHTTGGGRHIDVSAEGKLRDVLPQLIPNASGIEKGTLTIRRVVNNLDTPLEDLGIQDNDVLTFEALEVVNSKSVLILGSTLNNHPPIRITQSPSTLGRSDKSEINVANLLPPTHANSISRQQVKFIEDNGAWMVRLHENASMPGVYLNKQQLTDRLIPVTSGAILSIGLDPNAPVLELYLKLEQQGN
jgi:hypothetical protein